jgi:uncharacterized protein (DUF2147 family)
MRLALLTTALALFAAPALARDPAVGLWQTEPDRAELTSHIRIDECGAALCGQIVAAFDPEGNPVTTPNVGKPLFWDMQPDGAGAYAGGTAWIPLLNVEAEASMALDDGHLVVQGCNAGVCTSQTWTRLP